MPADLTGFVLALFALGLWITLRRCPHCRHRNIHHHHNAIGVRICRKCYAACPSARKGGPA